MLFVSFFLQRNRMRHVFLAPSLRVAAPSPWQRKNGEMRKCGGECGYTLATSPQSSRGRFRLALKCSPNSHKWTCWQASLSLFFLSQEPFDQFGTSLMTMFVMTLGELNYSDNFLDKELSFSTLSNVLFIVLVLGMPIIMMNMLVSEVRTTLVSLRDRTRKKRTVKHLSWQRLHGYYLRVLSGSSLEINAFWSFTKRSVQRKVKFGGTFFQQNHRHACHTRFAVSFPLPSCWWGKGGGGEIACDGGVRANREGGFSLPSLYPLFASLFPLYPRNFYKTTSQSLCDCSATLSVAQLKHDTM